MSRVLLVKALKLFTVLLERFPVRRAEIRGLSNLLSNLDAVMAAEMGEQLLGLLLITRF